MSTKYITVTVNKLSTLNLIVDRLASGVETEDDPYKKIRKLEVLMQAHKASKARSKSFSLTVPEFTIYKKMMGISPNLRKRN